jgi:hypothetical protein
MNKEVKLRLCAVAGAALVAFSLAACGDDDESADSGTETTTEASTESAEEVTLVANDAGGDYTFELSATPTADTKSVVFDNQGAEPHALVFARINEGYTVDEAFELQGGKGSAETIIEGAGAEPGKSTTVEIKEPLEPGSYAMLCPIGSPDGPHYKLGQLEEFEIQ